MKKVTDADEKLVDQLLRNEYNNKIAKLQIEQRDENKKRNNEYYIRINSLQNLYHQKPKVRVIYEELHSMISMVLETGDNGTKVIRKYAQEHGKDEQWCKDIAKPRAGKLFNTVITEHEKHPLIISMKERKKYCKKDILNNSVTGALTKLAKQISDYKELVDKDNEITEGIKMLELKNLFANKAPDWVEAQKLRDSGMTVRKVAEIMGVSKSAVQKHTKGKPKG